MGVWTHIQEKIIQNSDTLTMNASSPVGNILIGCVSWFTSGPTGYSEANGNGVNGTSSGIEGAISCQGVYIPVTIPGTISLTAAGLVDRGVIVLIEFSPGGGVITAGTAAFGGDSDPNAMAGGSVTLPAIPSLVVVCGGTSEAVGSVTPPTNYTIGPVGVNGPNQGLVSAYNLSEITSPIAPAFGYTGGGVWALVSASFKSVGGVQNIAGTLIMNSRLLSIKGGSNLLVTG